MSATSRRQARGRVCSQRWGDQDSFAAEASLGIGVFATSIANLTKTHAFTRTSSNTLPFLLHHFDTAAYATLSSSTGQQIMKHRVPNLVTQFPFLLEAVLAFSASHMSYLKQEQTTKMPRERQMSIAATWHITRALRGYGRKINDFLALAPPPERAEEDERKGMDALVAACLMLTSLFFHINWSNDQTQIWSSLLMPDETCAASTEGVGDGLGSYPRGLGNPVFFLNSVPGISEPPALVAARSPRPKCEWLTNVTGMSVIISLPQFRLHVNESIWYPFLAEAREAEESNYTVSDLEQNIAAWTTAQQLALSQDRRVDAPRTCDDFNPLLDLPRKDPVPHLRLMVIRSPNKGVLTPVVDNLIRILTLNPSDFDTFGQIISYPSRFSPELPPLIASRDVIALLILGYWFGLLEGVPHWWCYARGRAEGLIIQKWLLAIVRDMDAKIVEWGAFRETCRDRQNRVDLAQAVEEYVDWRRARQLGQATAWHSV